MELFIPSLLVIVLGGLVFFFLLPKMTLQVMGVMSIALFVLGVYQHRKTFPFEYSMSETKEILKDYAPFITLLVTILVLVGVGLQMTGGSGGSLMAAMPAMPAMPSMPSMPAMPSMPEMPAMPTLGLGTPGNNKSKGLMNLGGNNGKRNSLASNSFKVT